MARLSRWFAVLGVVALTWLAFAGGATAQHARVGGGTPLRFPLVPAYQECTSPNATHIAPLSYGSCSPPQLESPLLTMGRAGAGQGSVRLDVLCNDGMAPPCPSSGDQEDDRVIFSATDVRCSLSGPNCPSAGADYEGTVLVQLGLRLTDHSNPAVCTNATGGPPCITATVQDFTFSVPVQCADNGGSSGGNCALTTTFDALEPGSIKELQRQVVDVRSLAVTDAGPDGIVTPTPASDPLGLGCPAVCGSGDESRYLKAGWFNS